MGKRRTGNGTLGRIAVKPVLLLVLLLGGCKAIPQIAGVVSGGTVGAATGSPALGFAVGVATDAAGHAVVRWYGRSRQHSEQNAIADAAGPLGPGDSADWRIDHTIPIGNEHGTLNVVRLIDSPLAQCKEIAFSVDEGKPPKLQQTWYTTTICRHDQGWRWAAAEPAVERWGFLQ
jgi:hypothetical protein